MRAPPLAAYDMPVSYAHYRSDNKAVNGRQSCVPYGVHQLGWH